jgi:magnesium chelatase accessory protein
MTPAGQLDWTRDGVDWPHRDASRFATAGGLVWHVQQMGEGPDLVLVHGTGASTHSWRDIAPRLAGRYRVTMMDLPGHAFTSRPALDGMSLSGMSGALSQLLEAERVRPAFVVGHSAGAAILLRMCLDRLISPRSVISLNGALTPFPGLAGQVFPPLARLLYLNPVAPRIVAWRASAPGAVARLLAGMGSPLDATGLGFYERLFRAPGHVDGALTMMACWDLGPLARDLPRLDVPLVLVAGGNDRAIPAEDAFKIRDRVKTARVEYVRHLGHLAHEERPDEIATLILKLSEAGAAADTPAARSRERP